MAAVRRTPREIKYTRLLASLRPQGILQVAESYNVPATETSVKQYKDYKTRITNKCSAVAEMGNRLTTIDTGRKCGLGRGVPSYQVAS